MEAFEKFEHRGIVCELHTDDDPMSPADWDTLGTLVAFDSLWRNYRFASRESDSSEDRAIENGGSRLLIRYLRMACGMFAVPFHFHDYGSGGSRIFAGDETDESPDGFIFTTHARINELCGEDAEYHSPEWISTALRAELSNWNSYVSREVVGFVIRDTDGSVLESVWGFYPDESKPDDPDGLAHVRSEVKDLAEWIANDRETKARLWAFGNVKLESEDTN